MRIESGTSLPYVNQRAPAARAPAPAITTPAESSGIKDLDFTSMTRQEMFDWMNSQILSGAMTLDESTPFLGMTVKISVATMQPVEMATDETRYNFMDKMRDGIEGALWQHDTDHAERFQAALSLMKELQGEALSIDLFA